ncbi:hypothetical protein AYI68_g5803 [Smittium mucronatum]|uniref:Uncharacterized protein n=1 Tax=Smittium mucronatum TaxID=133383 RepID=A0A1R0GT83_9FUNG|nr:hypothetical protein AYI68_g5803 [Smittium mucronatum]
MSFFGKADNSPSWGGIFKQALSQVESKLDKVLEFHPDNNPQQGKKPQADNPNGRQRMAKGASTNPKNPNSVQSSSKRNLSESKNVKNLNAPVSKSTDSKKDSPGVKNLAPNLLSDPIYSKSSSDLSIKGSESTNVVTMNTDSENRSFSTQIIDSVKPNHTNVSNPTAEGTITNIDSMVSSAGEIVPLESLNSDSSSKLPSPNEAPSEVSDLFAAFGLEDSKNQIKNNDLGSDTQLNTTIDKIKDSSEPTEKIHSTSPISKSLSLNPDLLDKNTKKKPTNLDTLHKKYKVIERELYMSKETISSIKTSLETSEMENVKLNNEITRLKRGLISKSEELKGEKASNSELESQIEKLKEEIEQAQQKELRKQMRKLESEKSNMSSIVMQNTAPLLKKIEVLQSQLNKKSEDIQRMEKNSRDLNLEHDSKINSLSRKCSLLERKVEEYELAIKNLEEESESGKINQDANYGILSKNLELLEKENGLLMERIQSLEGENKEFQLKIEDFSNKEVQSQPLQPVNVNVESRNVLKNNEIFEEISDLKDFSEKQDQKSKHSRLDSISSSTSNASQVKSNIQQTISIPDNNEAQTKSQLMSQINILKNQLQSAFAQKSNLEMELEIKRTEIENLSQLREKNIDLEKSISDMENRPS